MPDLQGQDSATLTQNVSYAIMALNAGAPRNSHQLLIDWQAGEPAASATVAICVLSPISARKKATTVVPNTPQRGPSAVSPSPSLSGISVHAAIATRGVVCASPEAVKSLVDDGVVPGDRQVVVRLAVLVAGLALLTAIVALAERWLSSRIGEGLIYDLRTQVFGHVLRQPIAFFTRAQTGALVSRLGQDVIGAQQAFTSVLSNTVSNAISLVLILVAMASLSWQLTLGAVLLVPLFLVPAKLMGRRLADLSGFALHAAFPVWRFIHMQHHRFTNHDDGADPDHYTMEGPAWQRPLRWVTIDYAYIGFYLPKLGSRRPKERVEAVAFILIGIAVPVALIATGNVVAWLVILFIPSRLAIMWLAYAFDYLPHNGLHHKPTEDRMKTTRNRIGGERWVSPLMLYQNYHLVHHLHPIVPFYRYIAVWRRNEPRYLDGDPALWTLGGREITPDEYRRMRDLVEHHH